MSTTKKQSKQSTDARARRAAKSVGLYATKSRQRAAVPNLNNLGRFMLVDARHGFVIAGRGYSMSAEQVIAFCDARA